MEKIPDQTSNAGPVEPEMDLGDWLGEAQEFIQQASRAEGYPKQAQRLHYIRMAMEALKEAEAMLCR